MPTTPFHEVHSTEPLASESLSMPSSSTCQTLLRQPLSPSFSDSDSLSIGSYTPTRPRVRGTNSALLPPMLQATQNTSTEGISSPQHANTTPVGLRIPTTHSLDDALRYWEHGEPLKGLTVPLNRWAQLYEPSQYRREAQKLTMIKHVWEEFQIECGGNMEEFESRFPNLRYQYTKLIKAVREARIARGLSVRRSKQK